MKTRTSVLAKYKGCLVLIEIKKRKEGSGSCPQCGCKEFRLSKHGWTECCNDDCDFEVLTAHIEEIENQLDRVSVGDCKV